MPVLNSLPYITVGKILGQLRSEGMPVTRATFYRLEKRLDLPKGKRTHGKLQWRVYSRTDAKSLVKKIKGEYNFS